jgi:hypothetical protein
MNIAGTGMLLLYPWGATEMVVYIISSTGDVERMSQTGGEPERLSLQKAFLLACRMACRMAFTCCLWQGSIEFIGCDEETLSARMQLESLLLLQVVLRDICRQPSSRSRI